MGGTDNDSLLLGHMDNVDESRVTLLPDNMDDSDSVGSWGVELSLTGKSLWILEMPDGTVRDTSDQCQKMDLPPEETERRAQIFISDGNSVLQIARPSGFVHAV